MSNVVEINFVTTRKPAAVSMDPQMFEDAKARSKRLGFPTFSAYIVQLIRADLASGGSGMLIEETTTTPPVTEKRTETAYKPAKKAPGTRH